MMGVPITFMDKYNPEQFEIIDVAKAGAGNPKTKTREYDRQIEVSKNGTRKENATKLNDGPAIKVDAPPIGKTYYIVDSGYYRQEYARILIRPKKKGADA